MFTPGSGPATVGLSGFELFVDSQPDAASSETASTEDSNGRFMARTPRGSM
jgi:hypothetical protein